MKHQGGIMNDLHGFFVSSLGMGYGVWQHTAAIVSCNAHPNISQAGLVRYQCYTEYSLAYLIDS